MFHGYRDVHVMPFTGAQSSDYLLLLQSFSGVVSQTRDLHPSCSTLCLSSPRPCFFIVIVPRLFEEKRRDIVFGFPSFRPSIRPSVLPSFRLSVPLKYYVPCVRNSSYSFMPIHLKLYRCFCHGLKICMWFGFYPEIIFCIFFRSLNLAIF